MHEFVWADGEIIPAGEATVAAVSPAALYGKGVFTTLRVVDAAPFVWEKHWARLCGNARALDIDLAGHSETAVRSALAELIMHNGVRSGRARITLFDLSSADLWPLDRAAGTGAMITTGSLREPPGTFRLTVSPYKVNASSPLSAIKSCNYLDTTISLAEAKQRSFHEALRSNERGEIVSACTANVFWRKGGELFTPAIETGCIAGTTREYVLEKLACREVSAPMSDLLSADAVYLTSAGVGVIAAAELSGRELDRTPHEIMSLF